MKEEGSPGSLVQSNESRCRAGRERWTKRLGETTESMMQNLHEIYCYLLFVLYHRTPPFGITLMQIIPFQLLPIVIFQANFNIIFPSSSKQSPTMRYYNRNLCSLFVPGIRATLPTYLILLVFFTPVLLSDYDIP
jgi:hypothetical protein